MRLLSIPPEFYRRELEFFFFFFLFKIFPRSSFISMVSHAQPLLRSYLRLSRIPQLPARRPSEKAQQILRTAPRPSLRTLWDVSRRGLPGSAWAFCVSGLAPGRSSVFLASVCSVRIGSVIKFCGGIWFILSAWNVLLCCYNGSERSVLTAPYYVHIKSILYNVNIVNCNLHFVKTIYY